MKNNGRQICKQIIAIVMTITFVIGCGKEPLEDTSSDSSSLPSANPELGVVQEDSFYVRLYDEGKFPYYMSKLGDFNTKCAINKGVSAQSLDCVLDMNELDLYFHGMSFQYNVPSGLCSYVEFRTYWYYNFEVGYGPTSIVKNESQDAAGIVTGSSCTIDGVAGCSGTEAVYGTEGPRCKYDYTATGGPNCCVGSYSLTNNTTTPSGTTSTTSILGWGGNIGNCIGGAGKTSWTKYSKEGYPRSQIYHTPAKGLNERYDVKGPIDSTNVGSNFPNSNYFTASKHTHSGYFESRVSSLPYIVDPIDDRNGTPLYSGNPAYTWSCLDRNDELVNQIRVYVREWNTNKEFVKYGTSKGASGDPDIAGVEGSTCDYTTGSGYCNDSFDLDDISRTTYNSSTKPELFPRESY